jgi:HK97 family phage major capsid protein
MKAIMQEADALTAPGSEMTKEKRARLDYLLAAAKLGKKATRGVMSRELRAWKKYVVTGDISEYRATVLESGKGDITSSAGSAGGYFVPAQMEKLVFEAAAQTDPLLSEENVGLIQDGGSYTMQPKQISGWDLSTISSTQVAENTLQSPGTIPTVAGGTLNGYLHRLSLAGTMEFEDDAFMRALELMSRAFGVGFARGIGASLVNGTGSAQPQGLLTGAANSGVTTTGAGAIILDDIENVYFSLNKVYRNSPKCAWVVNDGVYKMIRKAKDASGRPLLSVERDDEILMGKKLLVSPTLSANAGDKGIIFGDLSHFVVRLSALKIARNSQAPGYAEAGKALYNGRMRVDSSVFDPSAGGSAPILYATLHA